MSTRILIVDDDLVSCQLFAKALKGDGYEVEWVHTGEDALARVSQRPPDLLLIDVRLPGMTGLEVMHEVHTQHPALPVIVITGFGSMETAVDAIQDGAFDYISKPMNLEELSHTVARALAPQAVQNHAGHDADDRMDREPTSTIIGRSPAMVEVYRTVARVAPSKSTVLVLGESGTGKELIARAIHRHSDRARRPFVAVDCGVLTETLLESELFGHVRGSFTGAVADKKGVFEAAHGGTCFLDEIGDISLNMQAKLLRVLQEHEIRRVGGKDWIAVDVRVVAATNRNLAEMVKQGTFRHDLYYRLHVITVKLPPLRDRGEDIPALAHYFLRCYSKENHKDISAIANDALALLQAYPWPGNIRELENAMERAVTLARQSTMTAEDLPEEIRDNRPITWTSDLSREEESFFAKLPSLDTVEKRYVEYVLKRTQGNLSHAAKVLDIDRRSLYRLLERLKIAPFHKGLSWVISSSALIAQGFS